MTTNSQLRAIRPRGPVPIGAVVLAAAMLHGCAATADTPVAEQAFRMTLPGPWTSRHDASGTLWIFGSSARPEQLTVELSYAARPIEPDLQAETLEQLVERRRKAQVMRAQSPVLLTETLRSIQGDTLVARYEGIEPVGPRFTATMLLVTRDLAAAFYFEHAGDRDDATVARVRAVYDSVVLRAAHGGVLSEP